MSTVQKIVEASHLEPGTPRGGATPRAWPAALPTLGEDVPVEPPAPPPARPAVNFSSAPPVEAAAPPAPPVDPHEELMCGWLGKQDGYVTVTRRLRDGYETVK